jgi:eukaryotic-like serine/threonine-protein kinase
MTMLGGRYRLTERIAAGGMGEVWRADDTVLGRAVAVKVLKAEYADSPEFRTRFRREARLAAALSHPGVAQVYDSGDGEGDQQPYLVMELVDGEPLGAVLARVGRLDASRTAHVVAQAAAALGAAHRAGLVHRDVKPGNLLISGDGTVKITDFGIARAVDGSGHTQTGEVLGTPHYLSPEQALGEAATGASDLYALGVVAHELLTGRRPFDKGTPVATALAQVNDPPPPLPPHVPPGLRSLIEQCLAKKAADRPASARELGERLGVPEGDLPEATEDAADVVGTAAAAEESVDDRPAAPPRWTGGTDPTPTPTSVPVVPKGHVHWAWVPGFSVALLAVATLSYSLAR